MGYRRSFYQALSVLAEYRADHALAFCLEAAISMPIPLPGSDNIRQCITEAIMAHPELQVAIIDFYGHILATNENMRSGLAPFLGDNLLGESLFEALSPERAALHSRQIQRARDTRQRQYFTDAGWNGTRFEVLVYPLSDGCGSISRLLVVSRAVRSRRFVYAENLGEARVIE